jgi:Spy/CpxP family protein refolding chaperone
MRRFNVVVVLASLFLGAPVALSQMHGGPGGGFEGMHGMHMLLRAANLTPDQKNQVHDFMKAERTQNKATFQQIRALQEQIADKLAGTAAVNLNDLNALQGQITQLRGQIALQSMKTAVQIRTLLTPVQVSKVADMHVKMKALREQEHQLFQEETEEEGAATAIIPER